MLHRITLPSIFRGTDLLLASYKEVDIAKDETLFNLSYL